MSAKSFFSVLGHWLVFPFMGSALAIRLSKAKGKANTYKHYPEDLLEEDRYTYVWKMVNNLFFINNKKIKVEGIDKIPGRPCLFICNHKSDIDPIIMLKIFNDYKDKLTVRPVFVAKKEIESRKKVGSAAKLIDTIFLDRSNIREFVKVLDKEKEILAKRSVVVFIEGTRIDHHEFGEFKQAALEPAYGTMCPIIPTVIYGTLGLKKNGKDFKYKEFTVKFLDPIKYKDFIHFSKQNVSEKLKELMEKEYKSLLEKDPKNKKTKNQEQEKNKEKTEIEDKQKKNKK